MTVGLCWGRSRGVVGTGEQESPHFNGEATALLQSTNALWKCSFDADRSSSFPKETRNGDF